MEYGSFVKPAASMGFPQFGLGRITSTLYRYQSLAMGMTVWQLSFRSHQIFVPLLNCHRSDTAANNQTAASTDRWLQTG
jgi:hypothetical protein